MKPISVGIFLFLIGFVLMALSFGYPRYTDAEAVRKLNNAEPTGATPAQEIRNYYREIAKYQTPKNRLFDLSTGLMFLALSWAGWLWFCRVRRFADFREIETPKSKQVVFLLANIAWLLLIPAGFVYYARTMIRGDYPWFADSIAIPIFGTTISCLILLVFINLFWNFVLKNAVLPNKLWVRPRGHRTQYWVWLAVICLLMLFPVYSLIDAVKSGDILAVPSYFLGIHLLLCARAIIACKS
jgi:hypothetical protein